LSAQKKVAEHVQVQAEFLKDKLEPRLAEARAGRRDVFFADAAHFVLGTFLCCLWCKMRLFVKAAAGRQRYNVLGAWNAVTNSLVAVTNTTVVSSETACELLRKIAAQSMGRPVTVVLDNARYQYCHVVQDLAQRLGIELLFLPSYSPNLNLIERLWKFVKKKALRGRYYATFADFRAGIDDCIAQIETANRPALATLMTHNFQTFDNVSILAG
jgi:transposase